MNTVCITGAGGYLGSQMVGFYLEKGWRVIAIDRFYFGPTLSNISNTALTIVQADIRSFPKTILKNVDVVIHLASISNDPAADLNPSVTRAINHKGAAHVAKTAKAMGVRVFLFASSCSVYGHHEGIADETAPPDPLTEYAASKLSAERDILPMQSASFRVVILRLATLFGLSPRRMRFDLIINLMTLHAWKSGKIFIMGGGQHWRPVIHLDDAIRAFYYFSDSRTVSKIREAVYNVGTDKQNFKIYQIGRLFKNHFPGLIIEEAPGDPEKRSYRVSFQRIQSAGFQTKKDIGSGIEEIRTALDNGVIQDDIRTSTLKYYQYLIEADTLLSAIKIRNRIF